MNMLLEWTYVWIRTFGPILLIALAGCTSLPERQSAPLPYETRIHAVYPLVDLIGADTADYLRPLPWLTIAPQDGPPMSLYRLNVVYQPSNRAQVPDACLPRFEGDRVSATYHLQGADIDPLRSGRTRFSALVQSGAFVGFVDHESQEEKMVALPVSTSGANIAAWLGQHVAQPDLALEKICRWPSIDRPNSVIEDVAVGALAIALFSPIAVLSWGYVGAYEATHSSGIGDVPRDAAWEAIAPKFPIGETLSQSPETLMADYPNKWRLIEGAGDALDYIVLEPGRPRKSEGDRSFERRNVVIGLQENRVEWAGWVEEYLCEQLPLVDREQVCHQGWVHFRE